MELSSKKSIKKKKPQTLSVRAREVRRKERNGKLLNESHTPDVRPQHKQPVVRTNTNKKVEGKSIYKVIIKLLYSSGKKSPNQPKLPFPLFTGMGNRGFGVFIYRTLQNEQLFFVCLNLVGRDL